MVTKTTREEFCKRHPKYKCMRRADPIQFNVLYYEWYRYEIANRWAINNYLKTK
jgi:hypothetical protein